MTNRKTPDTAEVELTLDFEGLLGAGRVFDATGDAAKQAELIEANGNKVGTEGCQGGA